MDTTPTGQAIVALGAFSPAIAAIIVRRRVTRAGFGDAGLRPRFRRTTRRGGGARSRLRRALLLGIVGLFTLASCGALYQTVATSSDRRAFPPPGALVDVGGYRLHLHCLGQGSPTVILEAGLGAPSPSWAWVQPEVGAETRVCAYDRAGFGWSDPGPAPRDAQQIARELHTLLGNAGVAGPYILVGYSYGGLYARAYAARYPAEVAGMVLVDASHPGGWTRDPDGAAAYANSRRLAALAPALARLGVLRATGFLRADPDLPPPQRRAAQACLNATGFANTYRAEFFATPETNATVLAGGTLGNRPLVVLTATDHGFPAQAEARHGELQRELLALSSDRVHLVVDGATHGSLLTRQGDARATSAGILRVVAALRSGRPLAR